MVKKMGKILVMNGPNLDMLGIREPGVYGKGTLADLEEKVAAHAETRGVKVKFFQSNSEGKLVKQIHKALGAFDGIVYNPGAHTHYSYALRDALGSVEVPCVEVHLSDVDAREAFRRISVTAPACVAQVKGRGVQGYCDAIDILLSGAHTRLGEGYESRYPKGQVIIGQPEGVLASGNEPAGAACDAAAQQARLERMRASMAAEGMRAFVVRDTSSIRWATAVDGVFDEEGAHALTVTADAAVLHTDSRYEDALRRALDGTSIEVDVERATHAKASARVVPPSPEDAIAPTISGWRTGTAAGVAAARSGRDVGIEDAMGLAEYRRFERAFAPLRLRETNGFVLGLRAVKDADEISRMRAAQAITDAAFAHICGFIRPGMTELEVRIELEDYMVRHGADGLAFPSIVACGPNAAAPHSVPGATRFEAGQCVVMDFGARAKGYCSDMTRTVFLGTPSEKMRDAYAVICCANEEVEALLRPGVTGKQAHELAERILAEGGFAGRMGHGLGHGVGIDIHEEPTLSPRNDRPLAFGNVVTVEPGIYLPGEFGMRLEDFGVITEDGFDVFTRSSHDMVVL